MAFISSFFKVLLVIVSLSFIVGDIVVVNKLTRETVARMKHRLVLSEFESQHKMRLQVSNSSNSCVIAEPDQPNTHSLESKKVHQPVVLLRPDDGNCDVYHKILKAERVGYSGIIFYSDVIDNFQKIPLIRGFYASVVSKNDGHLLSKFDGSSYKISIFRDCNIIEKIFDNFDKWINFDKWVNFDKWIIAVGNLFNVIQKFIATLLCIVLPASLNYLIVRLVNYYLTRVRNTDEDNIEQNTEENEKQNARPNTNRKARREAKKNARRNEKQNERHQKEEHSNRKQYQQEEDEDEEIQVEQEMLIVQYARILDASIYANVAEIKAAFRIKARELHPDKNPHLSEREKSAREEQFKICVKAKKFWLQYYGE